MALARVGDADTTTAYARLTLGNPPAREVLCIDMLELQQRQLIGGLQELYCRHVTHNLWHSEQLAAYNGKPSASDILSALDIACPDACLSQAASACGADEMPRSRPNKRGANIRLEKSPTASPGERYFFHWERAPQRRPNGASISSGTGHGVAPATALPHESPMSDARWDVCPPRLVGSPHHGSSSDTPPSQDVLEDGSCDAYVQQSKPFQRGMELLWMVSTEPGTRQDGSHLSAYAPNIEIDHDWLGRWQYIDCSWLDEDLPLPATGSQAHT